ncbi:glutathione synthetase [Sphaceloma murrayae]|uniref:Glutathione synthetase n=1 Tax=Sphaceloma murrayae TaxID=2082308 RepID=A0A2K1QTP5_9PEZI|nr:glutathione synthetase [Sphaceloma murrayae]
MLNTLANHGYLPRSGLNVTLDNAVNAMKTALNMDPALATALWKTGITTNPEPNAQAFTLKQLRQHNLIEHDASISRQDAFFGNNWEFNQTIFDSTRQFWTNETLDRFQLANGKIFRGLQSKAFNPTYFFTPTYEKFSLIEMAAPVTAFGDVQAVTVNRTLVEYFFENERLPFELGWRVRPDAVGPADMNRLIGIIAEAASFINGKLPSSPPEKKPAAGLIVQPGQA